MNESLSANEVLEVIRKAIRGDIVISLDGGGSWTETYCGNVGFFFGDHRMLIFNDCNVLDYVEEAISPDGRRGDFHSWIKTSDDPVRMLNETERATLSRLLEAAV